MTKWFKKSNHTEQVLYAQLFDILEKTKKYEAKGCQQKLGIASKTHYRKIKHELFEQILCALRHFKTESPRVKIYQELIDAETLYLRALPEEAWIVLEQAKKSAVFYEFEEELMTILEWQNKIAWNTKSWILYEGVIGAQKNLVVLHQTLQHYKELNQQWLSAQALVGMPRNEQEASIYKKLLIHIQSREREKFPSVRSACYHYFIKAGCLRMLGLNQDQRTELIKLLGIIQEKEGVRLSNPNTVMQIFTELLDNLLEDKEDDLLRHYLKVLKSHFFLSPTSQQQVNALYDHYVFLHAQKQNDQETMEHQIRISLNYLTEKKEPNTHHLSLILSVAWFKLIQEKKSEALMWINYILQAQNTAVKHHYIQGYARIVELMIHFDLQNWDFLFYRIESSKHFLKKEHHLYAAEQVVLAFVQKIDRQPVLAGKKSIWFETIQKLEKLKQENYESNVYKYVNLLDWFYARAKV